MVTFKNQQVLTRREHMRGGEGAAQLTALLAALPENARLFSTIRLAPGASIGYHVHERETELFYFAQGSGTVDDNGEKVKVSAGDAMATFSGQGHAVVNDGQEDLVLVAAIVKDPA